MSLQRRAERSLPDIRTAAYEAGSKAAENEPPLTAEQIEICAAALAPVIVAARRRAAAQAHARSKVDGKAAS